MVLPQQNFDVKYTQFQDLKDIFLLGSDLLGPEKFTINLGKKEPFIRSCNITVLINIGSRSNAPAVQRAVHIHKTTSVPQHSIMPLLVHDFGDIPKDRDYLFKPDDVNFSLYTHLIDVEISSIVVRNDTAKTLQIPQNFRLGHLTELDQ